MALRFAKYSGAGNDFAVADAGEAAGLEPGPLARRICPRTTGVGVDGLILVARDGTGRVRIRFFNPDGSEFSTCGNGTRCAARYALDLGLVDGQPFTIETPAAEISASSAPEGIVLDYRIDARVIGARRVEWTDGPREGWLVWMGLPHFVLPLDALPEGPIEEACRSIRRHPSLGEEGANVNLVALADRAAGYIRTFERGVEGETLACGSGAMASVLALRAAGRCDHHVSLCTRSGEIVSVTLGDEEPAGPGADGGPASIRLTGPARRVFEGTFPTGADG